MDLILPLLLLPVQIIVKLAGLCPAAVCSPRRIYWVSWVNWASLLCKLSNIGLCHSAPFPYVQYPQSVCKGFCVFFCFCVWFGVISLVHDVSTETRRFGDFYSEPGQERSDIYSTAKVLVEYLIALFSNLLAVCPSGISQLTNFPWQGPSLHTVALPYPAVSETSWFLTTVFLGVIPAVSALAHWILPWDFLSITRVTHQKYLLDRQHSLKENVYSTLQT